jgi:hypothetical protein
MVLWSDVKRGGDGMNMLDLGLETFAAWLAIREHEVVGLPHLCFQSPLACWLSEMTGHLYGVDDGKFGWALWDYCYWRSLPRWARLFSCWLEARQAEVVTGQDAFCVLADVELALSGAVSGGV